MMMVKGRRKKVDDLKTELNVNLSSDIIKHH